ncbi:MAG: ribosome maturation factor RimM [candidate division KSB1 bacterium]|nr:ribosome maturation factor RimM [candidate division KSB1 bacterium]MDZ7272968.1 ribosome maturation factor RimM [candidate division KSB1 bacterium]MDZ7285072.1 ribosome maturation factor RimM [candidate division KSB1 bacterium]MDZ7298104.1 ribosome maturation factor RimM [candidate division KSB1 bacterium]MDZ7308219.1 ribosome maturation factor RimM [candidate division KSB1 bacterium]
MADVKHVTIGVIVRPHGLHGMVKVLPETDDPERFRRLAAVELRLQGRSLGTFRLERVIVESRGVRIKFHQFDSLAAVEPLRGAEIVIAREACLPTREHEYYAFELLGLPVYTSAGRLVGTLSDIVPYPANDVWVVRDAERREWLIPAISSVIKSVELAVPRIVIEPLEGLLDDSTRLP